jgi:hypothetical protein
MMEADKTEWSKVMEKLKHEVKSMTVEEHERLIKITTPDMTVDDVRYVLSLYEQYVKPVTRGSRETDWGGLPD